MTDIEASISSTKIPEGKEGKKEVPEHQQKEVSKAC
jgi:hypothetical protein